MRAMGRVILGAILMLGSAPYAVAQQPVSQPAVIAEVITLHSKILGEDRNIVVYDPEKFGINRLPSYPVLFLLDENDVTMVIGLVRYLSAYTPRLSPMLVVGIDGGQTRIRDLTPSRSSFDYLGKLDTNPDSFLKSSGGGESFAQFMRDELLPYVNEHYKAGPFRIIAGHSVGGLATLHSLSTHPEMFNAYFAVSPSLWWDRGTMIPMLRANLPSLAEKNRFLFLADSPEDGPFGHYVAQFESMLIAHKPAALQYLHNFYPTENHGTIVAKAYYDGLRWLYPEWDIEKGDSTAALIRRHFENIGKRLGYDVQPPGQLVDDWASNFMNNPATMRDALELLELNVKNFPQEPQAYVRLGDAYSKNGNTVKAIEAYRGANKLDPTAKYVRERIAALAAANK